MLSQYWQLKDALANHWNPWCHYSPFLPDHGGQIGVEDESHPRKVLIMASCKCLEQPEDYLPRVGVRTSIKWLATSTCASAIPSLHQKIRDYAMKYHTIIIAFNRECFETVYNDQKARHTLEGKRDEVSTCLRRFLKELLSDTRIMEANRMHTLAHNSISMSPTLVVIRTRPLVGSDMQQGRSSLQNNLIYYTIFLEKCYQLYFFI